ncbi:MAG: hypothetical protein LBH28_01200, partial [Oscillospiraceae bacterium]|nr:hypothetical protein [Oscillospiraceae bacterium]
MRQKIRAPAWVDEKPPVGINRVFLNLLGYKTDTAGNTYKEDGWCLKREISCFLYCLVEIGFCIASIWSLNVALRSDLEALPWLIVIVNFARFILNLFRAIWKRIDSHRIDEGTGKPVINKRYSHQAVWHGVMLSFLFVFFAALWFCSRGQDQTLTPEAAIAIMKWVTVWLSGITQVF